MTDKKNQKQSEKKEITLEDVIPLHPNDYPAKHLKEKLDADRERMEGVRHASEHEPGLSGHG